MARSSNANADSTPHQLPPPPPALPHSGAPPPIIVVCPLTVAPFDLCPQVSYLIGGENARVRLKGIEDEDIQAGYVLCPRAELACPTVRRFECQLAIVELLEHKSIFSAQRRGQSVASWGPRRAPRIGSGGARLLSKSMVKGAALVGARLATTGSSSFV